MKHPKLQLEICTLITSPLFQIHCCGIDRLNKRNCATVQILLDLLRTPTLIWIPPAGEPEDEGPYLLQQPRVDLPGHHPDRLLPRTRRRWALTAGPRTLSHRLHEGLSCYCINFWFLVVFDGWRKLLFRRKCHSSLVVLFFFALFSHLNVTDEQTSKYVSIAQTNRGFPADLQQHTGF